jgi:hypothetical protein
MRFAAKKCRGCAPGQLLGFSQQAVASMPTEGASPPPLACALTPRDATLSPRWSMRLMTHEEARAQHMVVRRCGNCWYWTLPLRMSGALDDVIDPPRCTRVPPTPDVEQIALCGANGDNWCNHWRPCWNSEDDARTPLKTDLP